MTEGLYPQGTELKNILERQKAELEIGGEKFKGTMKREKKKKKGWGGYCSPGNYDRNLIFKCCILSADGTF